MSSGVSPRTITFPGAKVALFFGDRRVSNWSPLNEDGSSPWLHLNESGVDPHIRIVSADDELLYEGAVFGVPSPIGVGDTVQFPGLTLR